jgi:hypothetical protein
MPLRHVCRRAVAGRAHQSQGAIFTNHALLDIRPTSHTAKQRLPKTAF